MQEETKTKLVEYSKQEGEEVTNAVQEALDKYNGQLTIDQMIVDGKITARLLILKRVPNEQSNEQGENKENNKDTETSSEKTS